MTFYPAYMALSLGNIQIWINLMFTLACIAWIGGRQVLAGVIIACAAAIKPQLAALLLWGILWRRWPFCVGFVSAVIPIGILSVIVFGWHNNVSYFKVLSELSRHGEVCFANESVNGIVHRLIEGGSEDALTNAPATYGPFRPIVYVITLLFGMFIAALAFLPPLMRGKEDPKVADFAAAAVCFTVGSPIVWTFHYGILIPAFAIALKYIVELQSDSRKQDMMLALGIGWCLCASFLPVLRLLYTSPWNILGNPHLYGALLLLFVLIRSGHLWPKRVELPAQLEPVQRALTRRFGLAE